MSIFKKCEFYSKHKPLYRKISESDIFALVSVKSKAEEKTDTLILNLWANFNNNNKNTLY